MGDDVSSETVDAREAKEADVESVDGVEGEEGGRELEVKEVILASDLVGARGDGGASLKSTAKAVRAPM